MYLTPRFICRPLRWMSVDRAASARGCWLRATRHTVAQAIAATHSRRAIAAAGSCCQVSICCPPDFSSWNNSSMFQRQSYHSAIVSASTSGGTFVSRNHVARTRPSAARTSASTNRKGGAAPAIRWRSPALGRFRGAGQHDLRLRHVLTSRVPAMENVPHVAKRPLFTQFRLDRREPFLGAAGLGQTIVGPRQKQVPRRMPVAIMEGRIGLGVDDVHRRFAEAEPLDRPHHGSQFVQRRQGRARPTRPRFLYAVGGPQSDLERVQRVPRAVAHQQRGAHPAAFGNVPAAQRSAFSRKR